MQLICLAGLWILFGLDAYLTHDKARDDAVRWLSNIAAAVAIDIAHNAELLDRSLQSAATSWQNDEIRALKPSLRHRVLFERAMSTQTFGPLVVLDPYGSPLARSDEWQPDPYGAAHEMRGSSPSDVEDFSDREDFKAHIGSADAGLFVGTKVLSKADGQWSLPFSRRVTTPDGEFAGVVSGTLKLASIQDAYRRLQLRQNGLLALTTEDGNLLARLPEVSDAMRRAPPRLMAAQVGSGVEMGVFQKVSPLDGIERIYSFHRVGMLPLIQFAGLPVVEVYADWWRRTLTAGALLLVLSTGILILQLMLGRELRSRIEAETKLGQLALQDALTGIANRRVFDVALEREWQSGLRRGSEVGLLMIDVDHFKAFNDYYGHLAGDEALKAIAACLDDVARSWGGLACRFGGEEFAVLLPAVLGGGRPVAGDAVRSVRDKASPHAASPHGVVTISIGIGVAEPKPGESSYTLVDAADRQLYLAKQAGRDRFSPETRPSQTLAA